MSRAVYKYHAMYFCFELRHVHGVCSRRCWLFAPGRYSCKLASDLRRDLRMRVLAHNVAQRVFLLRREMRCIALAEHEEALVPENG